MRLFLQLIYRAYIITKALVQLLIGAAQLAIASCLAYVAFTFPSTFALFLLIPAAILLARGSAHFFGSLPIFTPQRPIKVPHGAGTSQFASRKHMKKSGIT